MKKLFNQILLTLLLLSCSTVFTFSQEKPLPTPQTSATPPVEEDDDVVKISIALIQLDVVVTDKSGKLVTDLKPEDFEVSENGEQQAITNLAYFSGQKSATTDANLNINNASTQKMPKIGEVRRTVAIVVDDANLSVQSFSLVKKELIKFINEQVQPNDLIAIIKTSRSVGILQQFTTDKKKLLDVINALHPQPLTNSGLSPFSPINISFNDQIRESMGGDLNDSAKAVFEQKSNAEFLSNINRNIIVTAGALGVLNSTIGAMSRLPGRKSILYVAEGINTLMIDGAVQSNVNSRAGSGGGKGGGQMIGMENSSSIFTESRQLEDKLRGVTEVANRATIAVYALDPRGTMPISVSAEDRIMGGMSQQQSGESSDAAMQNRNNQFKASQLGMKFLAEETGGKAFLNTNDLSKSMRDTLDSQNGYYIVGYQPDTDTFNADKRRFNKISVKVKRPNVNVTYRSGFFNVAETSEEKNSTPEKVFMQKLFSPYKYDEVDVKMTSVFAADEQTATIRAFVSVDPKSLKFADTAEGGKIANLDVVAVSFDANGIPVSQTGRRLDVKVSSNGFEKLLADGITFNLAFAARPKTSQQIKIAVRDAANNHTGTASQTLDLPGFNEKAINYSGIIMQNFSKQEWQNTQSGKPLADAANRMQTNTAQRKFKKGTVLSFNYAIYAPPSMRSKSQTQFIVFKDGKEVFKGATEDLIFASADKIQRVNKGGAFILGTEMEAGKYVLQITASGDAIKEPQTQQIDFELIN